MSNGNSANMLKINVQMEINLKLKFIESKEKETEKVIP